jgi:hypothetical protein
MQQCQQCQKTWRPTSFCTCLLPMLNDDHHKRMGMAHPHTSNNASITWQRYHQCSLIVFGHSRNSKRARHLLGKAIVRDNHQKIDDLLPMGDWENRAYFLSCSESITRWSSVVKHKWCCMISPTWWILFLMSLVNELHNCLFFYWS